MQFVHLLENHRDENHFKMKFLDNKILREANLVCAFARADKILNDENSTREDLHQSRSFLMEIFGKLEEILAGVKDNEEVAWHPRLLQTIVHYMQGSLSYILGDLPHAENELKVALMNLPGYVQCPVVIVTALSVYSELGRLYYRRKHLEESDKYFLKVISATSGTEAGPPPYSLQVSLPRLLCLFMNINLKSFYRVFPSNFKQSFLHD